MNGKIYTKKGDEGNTKTLRGAISKGDQLAIALGTIDELNSWIGVCREEVSKSNILSSMLGHDLRRIQNNLLNIGSGLAGSEKTVTEEETTHLERVIDKLTEELPELKNFVFPIGHLQVARTVARRAEREVVKTEIANAEMLKYLNRLSDGLFTFARWATMKSGYTEETWK